MSKLRKLFTMILLPPRAPQRHPVPARVWSRHSAYLHYRAGRG